MHNLLRTLKPPCYKGGACSLGQDGKILIPSEQIVQVFPFPALGRRNARQPPSYNHLRFAPILGSDRREIDFYAGTHGGANGDFLYKGTLGATGLGPDHRANERLDISFQSILGETSLAHTGMNYASFFDAEFHLAALLCGNGASHIRG